MLKNVCNKQFAKTCLCAVRTASTASGGGKLSGKVAVVTASTEGIGFAIAKRLAEDGARVMLSSRKQANVDNALQKLKSSNLDVSGIVCHVGRAEDRRKLVEKTVEQFGGIDILVSNAATNPSFGPIFDTTNEEAWDKIFDVNVKSAFFLCKDVVDVMEKRGGGSIVLVSSIAGYVPFELIPVYSVSKTALLGLVKAMAPQCAQKNIRVNGLAPGIIKTKFSRALWESENTLNLTEGQTMMKRLGTAEECANVVSFLVSDDASYMTAETIPVTGGMSSRL